MGIYDRDYYRREGPSFLASFTESGQVCKWLILLNGGIFVLQLLTRQSPQLAFDTDGIQRLSPASATFTDALVLNARAVLHGEVWRLLTYAFLHDTGTWAHIVFNMWFLWMFGREMEDLYGSREFLAFYLVAAVVGGLAYMSWQLAEGSTASVLGASGAVTAVMVLFAAHYPQRTFLLFLVIPVPIIALVIFQVIQDSYLFLGNIKTRTAVTCHLGGAAFGFLYFKGQWRLLNLWPGLHWQQRFRSRPRLRVYREEEEPVAVLEAPAADLDEQLEAKLDAVLEKMARSGKSSLTESEQDILLRASEIYKKRRT